MRWLFYLVHLAIFTCLPSANSSVFPPVVDPELLRFINGGDGSQGVSFKQGMALGSAGLLDVNGDGIVDAGINLDSSLGRVYVIFGGPGPWTPNVSATGSSVQEVNNIPPYNLDVIWVEDTIDSSGGDYDGDQIGDFGVRQQARCGPPCSISTPVVSLISGLDYDGRGFHGPGVLFVGDANGDGKDDRVYNVVAPATTTGTLVDHPVVRGQSGKLEFEGPQSNDYLELCDVSGGDINGDGLSDIGMAVMGNSGVSERYVYMFGRVGLFDANSVRFDQLGSLEDYSAIFIEHDGIAACDIKIDGRGDFNGDTIADMIVYFTTQDSEVQPKGYVVYGSPEFTNGETVELTLLDSQNGGDGSEGLALTYTESFNAMRYLGDINGDGFDDVGVTYASGSVVIYGRANSTESVFDLSSLDAANGADGSAGFQFSNDHSIVFSDHPLGDFNADTIDDFVLTVPDTGFAYIFFGRQAFDDLDEDGIEDQFDNCVSVTNADQRDTNGDGYGNACDADFNQDCIVNFQDAALFINAFQTSDLDYDIFEDGSVNFLDYLKFTDSFLLPPGPSGTASCP